jgi:hypothetical protein
MIIKEYKIEENQQYQEIIVGKGEPITIMWPGTHAVVLFKEYDSSIRKVLKLTFCFKEEKIPEHKTYNASFDRNENNYKYLESTMGATNLKHWFWSID